MPTDADSRYIVRYAETPADIEAAQRLRWLCFRSGQFDGGRAEAVTGDAPRQCGSVERETPANPPADGIDADAYDARCTHILVEDRASGRLVACCRFMALTGAEVLGSYSAQYYNLSGLADFDGRMIELGRFCIHPGWRDQTILRLVWDSIGAHESARGLAMLFGCSSFLGTDPAQHVAAFALLKDRHLAPPELLPRIKAPIVYPFAQTLDGVPPDERQARAAMPPLLRFYLALGGWVSDHAVVDTQLGTMHVFTALQLADLKAGRCRRFMPALAG